MAEKTDLPEEAPQLPGLDLTPAYTNYFSALIAPDTTRIAFAEAYGDVANANFHTVVAMTTGNAKALAELILRLIAENQAAQSTAGGEISEGRSGA